MEADKILSIFKHIKTVGAILGVPLVLVIFYHLHIERTETLKDKISLLETQISMKNDVIEATSFPNALDTMNAQKEMLSKEFEKEIKKQENNFRKEILKIRKQNKETIERLKSIKTDNPQEINSAIESIEKSGKSIEELESKNLLSGISSLLTIVMFSSLLSDDSVKEIRDELPRALYE